MKEDRRFMDIGQAHQIRIGGVKPGILILTRLPDMSHARTLKINSEETPQRVSLSVNVGWLFAFTMVAEFGN